MVTDPKIYVSVGEGERRQPQYQPGRRLGDDILAATRHVTNILAATRQLFYDMRKTSFFQDGTASSSLSEDEREDETSDEEPLSKE